MSEQERIKALVEDLRMSHPDIYPIAEQARQLVHNILPQASERVIYGGFMFATEADVCGVFVYTGHVSVEFGLGAQLADPHGVLEGKGKYRRHIKLHGLADIERKQLAEYVQRAAGHAEVEKEKTK